MAGSWRRYLEEFHSQRPGITETVFEHFEGGRAPVQSWILDGVPPSGAVLDLACGSGPLEGVLAPRWMGVDRSPTELGLARERGAGRVVVADAIALPVRATSVGVVVCSMSLMLFEPLDAALGEIARVLRPGQPLVALFPTSTPLTVRDRLRYTRLLVSLRSRGLRYPNDLADPTALLAAVGLTVVSDDCRRFECVIDHAETARLFVESLYLPGVEADRVASAAAVAQRWVGSAIGVPLRRIVAIRG